MPHRLRQKTPFLTDTTHRSRKGTVIFMGIVILTAFGVGGATVVGALVGFIFKNIPKRFNDIVLAFATGVMLASSVFGLISVSIETGGRGALAVTVAGIFAGALSLGVIAKLVPYLYKLLDIKATDDTNCHSAYSVLLFVIAIAIHNLPEGIAAGVGFGTGNIAQALIIAGGIALQNIPEGMVIIAPMIASGISPGRTLVCAVMTGVVEVIGTFLGYFAVTVTSAILPFALAFAGGTMLYVISDEMIPETHSEKGDGYVTYSLLAGFCIMMMLDVLLGG